MKFSKSSIVFALLTSFTGNIYGSTIKKNHITTETIVMMRHGEKPETETGQIDCKGLNRALKLPAVLIEKFGKPDHLFAPNPSDQIINENDGVSYNYFRPLITLEPLAIQLGQTINITYGISDKESVIKELLRKKNSDTLIFMAWEHKKLVTIAREIYALISTNNVETIPKWESNDFDSLYILEIKKDKDDAISDINFKIDAENLNNLSDVCPN